MQNRQLDLSFPSISPKSPTARVYYYIIGNDVTMLSKPRSFLNLSLFSRKKDFNALLRKDISAEEVMNAFPKGPVIVSLFSDYKSAFLFAEANRIGSVAHGFSMQSPVFKVYFRDPSNNAKIKFAEHDLPQHDKSLKLSLLSAFTTATALVPVRAYLIYRENKTELAPIIGVGQASPKEEEEKTRLVI